MLHLSPKVALTAAICSTLPVHLFTASSLFAADDLALSDLVVSASRTPQTVDETLAAVSVVTREDIEASSAQSLPEMLSRLVGVDFNVSGGYGKTTGLSLRGTSSTQVAVFIDGVRLRSATLGTTQFQFVPLDQIERIEVVRGPRAAIWGADAVGGAIHVFTRTAASGSQGTAAHGQLGIGSLGTREFSGSLSYRDTNDAFSLVVSQFESDGINSTTNQNPDLDGYDNRSVSLNYAHNFESGSELNLRVLNAEGTTAFDGFTLGNNDQTEFTQQVLSASFSNPWNDVWQSTFRIGQSKDLSTTLTNGVATGVFDTTSTTLTSQHDFELESLGLLTVGGDYRDDRVSSTTAYNQNSRADTAAYVQWQTEVDAWSGLVALRKGDDEQFGSHSTGNIELAFQWAKGPRVTAAYGEAFRAPTFNELFFPGFGVATLQPEKSKSVELGVKGKLLQSDWSVRAYRTEIRDLIQTVLVTPPFTFAPQNVAKARIDGIELELATVLQGWQLSSSVSLINPKNVGTGNKLRRRAEQIVQIQAHRQFDRLDVNASLSNYGRRFDDAANTIVLGGYTLLDAKLRYRLNSRFKLYAGVQNLLDDDYQTANNFNSLPRTWQLGVEVSID